MANSSRRGSSERVREKMLKISEKTTADRGKIKEITLRERLEEAEVAIYREERQRVQEAEWRYTLAMLF